MYTSIITNTTLTFILAILAFFNSIYIDNKKELHILGLFISESTFVKFTSMAFVFVCPDVDLKRDLGFMVAFHKLKCESTRVFDR